MLNQIIDPVLQLFSSLDYLSIIILMAIESSFIPLPSEVIMPPAGYLASTGQLNIWLVIAAGTLGSLLGALVNYFLAFWLGRTLLYKLARSRAGRWLFLSEGKLHASEFFFKSHGKSSTFIGRLIPAVRHLISLPAGLSQMNLGEFCLATVAGAVIWNAILAGLGYWFGANQAVIKQYYHWLSLAGGLLFIIFIGYLIYRIKIKKSKKGIV